MFLKWEGPDGQRCVEIRHKMQLSELIRLILRLSGIYETLVPLTKWCGLVFKTLYETGKPHPKVCAAAAHMQHILLVLQFLLHDHLCPVTNCVTMHRLLVQIMLRTLLQNSLRLFSRS